MAEFVESRFQWSKGDWGNKGAFLAGRADDGFFKGTNVMVYKDGSIGPRAGMVALGLTGAPTGEVRMFGYVPTTKDGYSGLFLMVVGNKAYWAPALELSGAWTEIGTLAGTETEFCSARPILSEGMCYFATRNQGIYKWNVSSGTLTQVSTTSGIYDMARYGERLYAATLRRVYYSDAADFSTWDEDLSWFDVGWQFANYRLGALRNNLFFFRQGGGHYILSGTPTSTSTLRETGSGLPPDEHSTTVIPSEDAAAWIPQVRNAPVYFRSGMVDPDRWAHLEDWTTSANGQRHGAYSYGEQTVAFLGATDHKMLVRHNGVWTKHEVGVDVERICRVSSDWFGFTDGGSASTAPSFWLWGYDFDKPGITEAGQGRRPGDGTDTPLAASIDLPEWWHPQGAEVRGLKVEVDFVSWGTGTAETAHFDLTIDALRTRSLESVSRDGNASATFSFDEAVASSSAAGDERRASFNVGDQGWGRGFQIHLTNIRSVSIRTITVSARAEPRNSR